MHDKDVKQTSEARPEKRTPRPDSWASIKRTLSKWDEPRLLGLVHDLFTTVPDARAAIVGRLTLDQPAKARKATLDALRAQVHKAIWPTRRPLDCKPDPRAARRIADQYLKASRDADGAILLYVEMLEASMQLWFEFGGMDPQLYHSTEGAAEAAERCMPTADDAAMLRELATRMAMLRDNKNLPGNDTDDAIASLADCLDARASALSHDQRPPEGS